jgi:hypothetical protein
VFTLQAGKCFAPPFSKNECVTYAVIPKGCHDYSPAQPQPNFLYENGEIASEKALAMTATMHFDGTRHVVIASEAKQSFSYK